MAEQRGFSDRLRLLQLETLHDLSLELHAQKDEQHLVEGLLERACAVLDPAAGAIVTRDAYGAPVAAASVGWPGAPPAPVVILGESLWRELLALGTTIERQSGFFAGRPYRELIAVPLAYRGVYLGYLTLIDKEARGAEGSQFGLEDRRFLESVAALGAVSIDSARQVARLEGERDRLVEENRALKERWDHQVAGRRIVAHSPATRRVIELAERVAPRGVSVLLRGESGTGKELIAKLLHVRSERGGPLIALNCGALPESLLESELFGIEGGVATGVQARRGKFELADGGTLFLDEIGDAPLSVQVRLLRALQEREITRVGGQRPVPVDVRLVAATHRPLEELVAQGTFREDLYYRLKGVEIAIPPLRERREDIPHLVRSFVEEFSAREGIPSPSFDRDALALLLSFDYPGNVRELQNVVEGAVSLAEGEVDATLVRSLLGQASAPRSAVGVGSGEGAVTGPEAMDLESVERKHIQRVLRLAGGNKSAAAKLLGLDRKTLARKGY
jgi:transcriptional regulator with GAF, ATPase, and Fis domain